MPRKPTSVFLIVEHPNTETLQSGMPPTYLQAWRLPLNGQSIKDVVEQHYANHPIGSTITVVEDTKVTQYQVGLTLDEVDDPRLTEPTSPGG